ncbi:hypothetical protein A5724_23625 [Mycobacterium sp. ACS1612]|nr:hypothetical protein A5724_23625 [Mycobacterium sp. ACS1612]
MPPELQWLAVIAGQEWPDGDEDAMYRLADDWKQAADKLEALLPGLDQVRNDTLAVLVGDTATAAKAQFDDLLDGENSIAHEVDALRALSAEAHDFAQHVEYAKVNIIATLVMTALEIAYALASASFTFGISLEWIPGYEALMELRWIQTIVKALRGIEEAINIGKGTVTLPKVIKYGGKQAFQELWQSVLQEVAVEAYQHDKRGTGFSGKNIGKAAIGGVVGGAVGGVLHHPVNHIVPPAKNVITKIVKGAATHYAIGIPANLAAAGATGSDIDAISVLGGAIPGAMTGAIHGVKENHGNAPPPPKEFDGDETKPLLGGDSDDDFLTEDSDLGHDPTVNAADPYGSTGGPTWSESEKTLVGDNGNGGSSIGAGRGGASADGQNNGVVAQNDSGTGRGSASANGQNSGTGAQNGTSAGQATSTGNGQNSGSGAQSGTAGGQGSATAGGQNSGTGAQNGTSAGQATSTGNGQNSGTGAQNGTSAGQATSTDNGQSAGSSTNGTLAGQKTGVAATAQGNGTGTQNTGTSVESNSSSANPAQSNGSGSGQPSKGSGQRAEVWDQSGQRSAGAGIGGRGPAGPGSAGTPQGASQASAASAAKSTSTSENDSGTRQVAQASSARQGEPTATPPKLDNPFRSAESPVVSKDGAGKSTKPRLSPQETQRLVREALARHAQSERPATHVDEPIDASVESRSISSEALGSDDVEITPRGDSDVDQEFNLNRGSDGDHDDFASDTETLVGDGPGTDSEKTRSNGAVAQDVSADESMQPDRHRLAPADGGGGVGSDDRFADGTAWHRDVDGWLVAGQGGRIDVGPGFGGPHVELPGGTRGVFDSNGVLQHVVLPDGTSHDRGLDGNWSRARENPGEVQVVKTGHGDVLASDNEKVIDTKTGETIAYRQIKHDNGHRLPQPKVLLPDGQGGWKETPVPLDTVRYEAWLAGANKAHDTARTMFDIAGRSGPSIPEPERLTHLGTEELKALLGGTPDDMKAALYEAVRRTKGVSLRWTQLSAGGALERGDVVNMAAGEGKSYLFLMSNALEAAKLAKAGEGGAVHMHTTRDVLAEQLEPDFRAVMEPLGYAVHRLNSDNPPPAPRPGQPTVYLGTSQDAAFTLLKHGSVGGHSGVGPGFHAEIDEIDEALVYSNGHYILSEGTGADAPRAVADPIKGIHKFLSDKLATGELTDADFGREPDTVGGPARLTEAGIAKAIALLNPHGKLTPAEVDAQLGKLDMAAAAHWEYVENVHYVIDDTTGKLYIIDQTTHQVLYDPRTSSESRWNGGLAQALEAKHGLTVRHDSDGDKKVTSQGLYETYSKVVGASGTANGKNELFAKQGLSSQIADISRYYTSGLTTHEIGVSANLKEKLTTIADDVQQMQALGDTARPQLILAHRNDLVKQLSAHLDERNVEHVSIDAKWFLKQGVDRDEAFKEVVAQAGKPGKVLVINMQGARGVDIPLDDAAKALGGLHVVVTGHSEVSKDIDIQAENRAARSGDPGSVKFYISPDDDLFRLSHNPQVQLAVIQYRAALHTGVDLTDSQQGLRDAVPVSQSDAALRMGIRQAPQARGPPPHTTTTDTADLHIAAEHQPPHRPPAGLSHVAPSRGPGGFSGASDEVDKKFSHSRDRAGDREVSDYDSDEGLPDTASQLPFGSTLVGGPTRQLPAPPGVGVDRGGLPYSELGLELKLADAPEGMACGAAMKWFLEEAYPGGLRPLGVSDDDVRERGGVAGALGRVVAGPGWGRLRDVGQLREAVRSRPGSTAVVAANRAVPLLNPVSAKTDPFVGHMMAPDPFVGHMMALHSLDPSTVDHGGEVLRWVDPQQQRVYGADVGPDLVPPELRAGAGAWAVVIDPHGRVLAPGEWSRRISNAEALLDPPRSHRFGMHGVEIEVHNVGLSIFGSALDSKTTLLTSKDNMISVVVDTKTVWVDKDGKYYETAEARDHAGAEPHPTEPKTKISVPEIVTEPARTLAGELSTFERHSLEQRVADLLQTLGSAKPGTRLSKLFPADGDYVVHGHSSIEVTRYPDMHADAPLYVQYTEDVPVAGIYAFLQHAASNARPSEPRRRFALSGLRFGRDVAGLIVQGRAQVDTDAPSDKRPPDEDMQMLVASEPLVSIMGPMALLYAEVAAIIFNLHTGGGLAKTKTLVMPRQSLRTIWRALGPEERREVSQHAQKIRDLFGRSFKRDYPKLAADDLMNHDISAFGGGKLTVKALLDEVLDPPDDRRLFDRAQLFATSTAKGGDRLNERGDGQLATVALEARYYGEPKHLKPKRLTNFSDQEMFRRDADTLVATTQDIDKFAFLAHQLNADPSGHDVITELTNLVAARVDEPQAPTTKLVAAIGRYLNENPTKAKDLALLLGPASQRLEVQLVPQAHATTGGPPRRTVSETPWSSESDDAERAPRRRPRKAGTPSQRSGDARGGQVAGQRARQPQQLPPLRRRQPRSEQQPVDSLPESGPPMRRVVRRRGGGAPRPRESSIDSARSAAPSSDSDDLRQTPRRGQLADATRPMPHNSGGQGGSAGGASDRPPVGVHLGPPREPLGGPTASGPLLASDPAAATPTTHHAGLPIAPADTGSPILHTESPLVESIAHPSTSPAGPSRSSTGAVEDADYVPFANLVPRHQSSSTGAGFAEQRDFAEPDDGFPSEAGASPQDRAVRRPLPTPREPLPTPLRRLRTEPWYVDFEVEGKEIGDKQRESIDAIAADVAELVAARSGAGGGPLIVHVDGGGNGSWMSLSGRNTTATDVGDQRARLISQALHDKVTLLLAGRPGSVEFAPPTSRGRPLRGDIPDRIENAARRVVIVRIDEAAPPHGGGESGQPRPPQDVLINLPPLHPTTVTPASAEETTDESESPNAPPLAVRHPVDLPPAASVAHPVESSTHNVSPSLAGHQQDSLASEVEQRPHTPLSEHGEPSRQPSQSEMSSKGKGKQRNDGQRSEGELRSRVEELEALPGLSALRDQWLADARRDLAAWESRKASASRQARPDVDRDDADGPSWWRSGIAGETWTALEANDPHRAGWVLGSAVNEVGLHPAAAAKLASLNVDATDVKAVGAEVQRAYGNLTADEQRVSTPNLVDQLVRAVLGLPVRVEKKGGSALPQATGSEQEARGPGQRQAGPSGSGHVTAADGDGPVVPPNTDVRRRLAVARDHADAADTALLRWIDAVDASLGDPADVDAIQAAVVSLDLISTKIEAARHGQVAVYRVPVGLAIGQDIVDGAGIQPIQRFPDQASHFVVASHGDAEKLWADGRPDGPGLSGTELGDLIERDPRWPRSEVILSICEAATNPADGPAAQLARRLPGTLIVAGQGDVQTTSDGWAVVEQTADTTGFLGFRYDPKTGSTEITQLSPFLHVSQPSARVDEIAFAHHLYDRAEGARKNAEVFDLAATRMRELDDWIEQHRTVDDEIAALRDRRVGGDPARPDGVTADEVRAVQETARAWLDRLASIEERIDSAIVLPAGLARQQALGTLNHELTTLTKELNAAVPTFQRLRAEGMTTSEAQEALLDRVLPTPQPGSPDLLPNPFDVIDDIGELPNPFDAFSEPPSPVEASSHITDTATDGEYSLEGQRLSDHASDRGGLARVSGRGGVFNRAGGAQVRLWLGPGHGGALSVAQLDGLMASDSLSALLGDGHGELSEVQCELLAGWLIGVLHPDGVRGVTVDDSVVGRGGVCRRTRRRAWAPRNHAVVAPG